MVPWLLILRFLFGGGSTVVGDKGVGVDRRASPGSAARLRGAAAGRPAGGGGGVEPLQPGGHRGGRRAAGPGRRPGLGGGGGPGGGVSCRRGIRRHPLPKFIQGGGSATGGVCMVLCHPECWVSAHFAESNFGGKCVFYVVVIFFANLNSQFFPVFFRGIAWRNWSSSPDSMKCTHHFFEPIFLFVIVFCSVCDSGVACKSTVPLCKLPSHLLLVCHFMIMSCE